MTKVLLKKSSVGDNAPGVGDLSYGEVAINYADGRLYYKNSSNEIKNFVDSDNIASTYIRSLLDDTSPELSSDLQISDNRINSIAGSYIGLQERYTDDSEGQVVISSHQDVVVLIDANQNASNAIFAVKSNDSDLDTASLVFSVNEIGEVNITGQVDMNLKQIVDLATPTTATGAATKAYVDQAVATGTSGLDFPYGSWGRVDSANLEDAFEIAISGDFYDMLTEPANSIGQVDLGTDSSI